nr:MAG TPA: hypothetical protein [Caudoviricetes sp.]
MTIVVTIWRSFFSFPSDICNVITKQRAKYTPHS